MGPTLLQEVFDALEEFFSDSSVKLEVTLEGLEDLAEFIGERIELVKAGIKQRDARDREK